MGTDYLCRNRLSTDDKCVLKNLHGEFKSRELTVILGPSGSGKSSLMNILSGFQPKHFTGVVKVNGSVRDQRQFRHVSSYVMQDSLLQPLLTVREAMSFSVNLKIGKELNKEDKHARVSRNTYQLMT